MNSKRKTGILFGILICLSITTISYAQQTKPSQRQCRAKAKEASKLAFDECMVAVRVEEAENLKKEFKVKVTKLKEQYEKKIRKLLGIQKNMAKKLEAQSTEEVSKTLPTKLPTKTQTSLVQEVENAKNKFEAPTPVMLSSDDIERLKEEKTNTETLPESMSDAQPTITVKEAPNSDNTSPQMFNNDPLSNALREDKAIENSANTLDKSLEEAPPAAF